MSFPEGRTLPLIPMGAFWLVLKQASLPVYKKTFGFSIYRDLLGAKPLRPQQTELQA